jgi:DNA transposition AAA+ family ATPase
MKNKIAITQNIKGYIVAMTTASDNVQINEGMAVLRGDAGTGKTTATAYVANRMNGIYVRAQRIWSVTSMLAAIVVELDGKPGRLKQPMFNQIIEVMKNIRRPLFIDEADYLDTDMIDTVRDMYDITRVPVILIGMDDIKRGLVHNQRFMRRITQEVVFSPMDKSDAVYVAGAICEAKVADDLLDYLLAQSNGNIGLFKNGLIEIETMVKKNGWQWDKPVTLNAWGDRTLFFGPGGAGNGR